MISSDGMRRLEDLSEKYGVSKLILMENAAKGLFREARSRVDLNEKRILVVCGPGNNGGDGLALSKYLVRHSHNARILFLGTQERLKKEAAFNYSYLKSTRPDLFVDDFRLIDSADIIFDCIFGTGISGQIKEPYSLVIDRINSSQAKVIAVDIPSGLDPDSGEVTDRMARFDIIMTFHDLKPGIEKFLKDVIVVDIGIPAKAVEEL
jgi:hydroxyethylthiazole kinase-like uncharacterized protein yjeF